MPPKRNPAKQEMDDVAKRRKILDPTTGIATDSGQEAAEDRAAKPNNSNEPSQNKNAKAAACAASVAPTKKHSREETTEDQSRGSESGGKETAEKEEEREARTEIDALKAAESALQAAMARNPREQHQKEIKKNPKNGTSRFQASKSGAMDATKQKGWEHNFFLLAVYKQKNGHVRFPGRKSAGETPLSKWVNAQRSTQGKKKLSEDQVAALNSLGFIWNVVQDEFERTWEARFRELQEYKEKHNNTQVPMDYEGGLGRWCSRQRSGYKMKQDLASGKLAKAIQSGEIEEPKGHLLITDEHFKKLDRLGFKWCLYEQSSWESRFEQLLGYKTKYGHCNVPQHWSEDKGLGRFVARQRYNYCLLKQGKLKTGSLAGERIAKLEAIEFDWGKFRPNTWKDPQSEEAKQEMVAARERLNEAKRAALELKERTKRPRGRPRKDAHYPIGNAPQYMPHASHKRTQSCL